MSRDVHAVLYMRDLERRLHDSLETRPLLFGVQLREPANTTKKWPGLVTRLRFRRARVGVVLGNVIY